jgi:Concanavalin A-like lectin/glucanases superfamily
MNDLRISMGLVIVSCVALFAGGARAGLTAYYNFEGNYNDYPGAGTFADDLANVRPGASLVNDPAPNAVGSTMAYAFDARTADSRVWTNAWSPDLNSTNKYTIMFWLKADDDLQALNNTRLATTRYRFNGGTSFTATNTIGAMNIGWQVEGFGQSASGNGPDLRIQGGAVGNFFAKPANGALGNDGDPNNDVWHHVAFVISNDGSTANNRAYMETYLDGVSLGQNENTPSTGTNLLANLDGALILGGHNSSSRSATGELDDFALFDEVLDASDIAAIARGEKSPADFLPGAAVPEPATCALTLLAAAALLRRRRTA